MGATSAQNQFRSAGCTIQVYSQGCNEWKFIAAPSSHFTGTLHSTRTQPMEEPPPVSLLPWSRGGLVIGPYRDWPFSHTEGIAQKSFKETATFTTSLYVPKRNVMWHKTYYAVG